MRETKKKQIGKYTYSVTQLGASEARRVYRRLLSLLGPASSAVDMSQKEATIVRALAAVVAHLSDSDFEFLCDTFGPVTAVSGGELGSKAPWLSDVFEEHFVGHMLDMSKWLVFCLEVNFSDFLDLLGSLGATGEKLSTSLSPSSATGTNGES